jgi:hypothetical protein
MVEARANGNEAAAIGSLRSIGSSQTLFRKADKEGDALLDYGTLRELGESSLVDPVLAAGIKQGFSFEVAPSASEPLTKWMAVANPMVPGSTGNRYFVTNHEGVIFYTSEGPPLELDPACKIPERCHPVGN